MAQEQFSGDDAAAGERGVQYPGDNLSDSIAMLEVLRDAVGFGSATRELIASALGYSSMSGRAARKLGSLSHFGLIDRSGKGVARISELGKSILMPRSELERRQAIVSAVKTPKLFLALLNRHSGHALPSLLPNLLTREHGVNPNVAAVAAATFRDSVEFAGLLRNGVLHGEPRISDEAKPSAEGPISDSVGTQTRDASETVAVSPTDDRAPAVSGRSSAVSREFSIALDRIRVARIVMPLPLSDRDLQKVGAWVNYMRTNIDEDETPDISSN